MDVSKGTESLQSVLENDNPRNVYETENSFGLLRPFVPRPLEEFHGTYHHVTRNIRDLLDLRLTHGVKIFKEEEVLHAATPTFLGLYAENIENPGVHWRWTEDERAMKVDGATRGALGYNSHIRGDLALTIRLLRQSGLFSEPQIRNYLFFDFAPKMDIVLWKTANQLAPALTNFENEKVTKVATGIFMLGVVGSRQIALHDARKMAKAKSDDEAEATLTESRLQTARVNDKILDLSLEMHTWAEKQAGRQIESTDSTVIDLGSRFRNTTTRKLAQFIGTSLRKAA